MLYDVPADNRWDNSPSIVDCPKGVRRFDFSISKRKYPLPGRWRSPLVEKEVPIEAKNGM